MDGDADKNRSVEMSRKRKASTQDTEVESSAVGGCTDKNKAFVSDVWEHFNRTMDTNGKKLLRSNCKYCNVSYASTCSTSTLSKHIPRCPKYPYNEKMKNQSTLESFKEGEGESKLLPWKFDKVKCREAIAEMIIIDELPFSFIEHEGFKRFVSVAQPRLDLVCRNTVAKDCMEIYNREKKKLKRDLSVNANRICLTSDIWTSLQNLSYMVLTSHFIDQEWKLHKRVLNFKVVNSHKGLAIASAIEACMIDWGIEKVFTITLDNASANDTAVDHLKKKLVRKGGVVLEGEFFHMRCCAHILNLIVRDGIGEIDESISRIRAAVRYIRSSPQRAHLFQDFVEREEIPHKSKLVLDVPTRWNYTFLMLKTALKFEKAFEVMDLETTLDSDLPNGSPTRSDWSRASTLCKFLETFYNVTRRFSGCLYVTSNTYFHDVFMIQRNLINWANDNNDIDLKAMAKSMQKKFDKYWGDMSKINMNLLLAVVLDPRFKLNYVKFCYGTIYSVEKVTELEKSVKDTLFRMYSCYEVINKNAKASVEKAVEKEKEVESSCSRDSFEDMQSAYYKHLEEVDNGAKSEIERFLDEIVEKKVGDFDILFWWKMNAHRFPVLSLIAKDILAIPITTVASESAFSTGGRVLDPFRSSLSPKVVESLICAQDWLRAAPLPIDVEMKLEDFSDCESVVTDNSDLVGSAFRD